MNVVQVILCLRNITFVSCFGVSIPNHVCHARKWKLLMFKGKALTLLCELQPMHKDIRNQAHSDLTHHEAKQRECGRTWNSTIFVVDIDSYNQNKQINGGGSCCIWIVQIGWQCTLLIHSPNMKNTSIGFTWSLHK